MLIATIDDFSQLALKVWGKGQQWIILVLLYLSVVLVINWYCFSQIVLPLALFKWTSSQSPTDIWIRPKVSVWIYRLRKIRAH